MVAGLGDGMICSFAVFVLSEELPRGCSLPKFVPWDGMIRNWYKQIKAIIADGINELSELSLKKKIELNYLF